MNNINKIICRLCKKKTILVCICGICNECTDKYGHDKAQKLAREKEK